MKQKANINHTLTIFAHYISFFLLTRPSPCTPPSLHMPHAPFHTALTPPSFPFTPPSLYTCHPPFLSHCLLSTHATLPFTPPSLSTCHPSFHTTLTPPSLHTCHPPFHTTLSPQIMQEDDKLWPVPDRIGRQVVC